MIYLQHRWLFLLEYTYIFIFFKIRSHKILFFLSEEAEGGVQMFKLPLFVGMRREAVEENMLNKGG